MHERDLFIAAIEMDDETARRTYLDSACAGNLELRERIERLLNRAAEAGEFLEQPAVDLCSDMDAGFPTEINEQQHAGSDPPTLLGKADDTGQTVLLNPEDSLAAAPKSGVASAPQSGLTEPASVFGTLFGRYRVERVLGSGGMGVVYLAEDLRLGRRVALKIPKFDADGKFSLSERFRREARTMASVLHRNLCPIFDVDEQDGTHFLTMAFIDGETLAEVLKREKTAATESSDRGVSGTTLAAGSREGSGELKPAASAMPLTDWKFTPRQIADLIRKLALALDEAHRAGIVHRDLKPANVMIDRTGEPIVMDFGLAWMVHETDARVTQSGAIVGTPAYMSPEQAEGTPDKVGAASDIYSLGAILYELLAGRPIHSGSVTRVLFKLMHERPIPPSSVRDDVDPNLEAICWKAISRRPEDRFATAGEFAEALARLLEGRPWEDSLTRNVSEGEHVTGPIIPNFVKRSPSLKRWVSDPDRTDVLPPDSGAETIAYQTPSSIAPRGKSRIVLASLLLIGMLGVVWAIVTTRGTPKQNEVTLNPKGEDRTAANSPVDTKQKTVADPKPSPNFVLEMLTSSDWEWTKPENLGPAVNTVGPETSPHFSADGRRLWFERGIDAKNDLAWIAERETPDKPWNPAKSIGRAFEFSGPMADSFVSRDERTWIFVTWGAPRFAQQLQESTRSSPQADWSPPQWLAAAGVPAQFPVLSNDGLTLFLTNSQQGDGLYSLSRPDTNAPWSEPIRVPGPVNSGEGVRATWLSKDGRVLLFHSVHGHGGGTKEFNLWLTTRPATTAPWQEPVRFGPIINSSANEIGACLSDDGRELIFASDRSGGSGDFDLYVSRHVPKPTVRPLIAPAPSIAKAPFDANLARAHQAAWAKHLGVPVEHTNDIGMKFVLIPPGEFIMGSTPEEIQAAPMLVGEDPAWKTIAHTEAPQHKVILTKPFYLAVHEVTQAVYAGVMGKNPSIMSSQGGYKERVAGLDTSNFPVDTINWHEATEFCNKLSQLRGLELLTVETLAAGEPVLKGNGYRLPTEAEWEFACRAGTTTSSWNGDSREEINAIGWTGANSNHRTHEVGGLKSNPFGLFDMHGNVWEWVQDQGNPTYYERFAERAAIDPWCPPPSDDSPRVVRGGFWATPEPRCISGRRFFQSPREHYGHNGFRVAFSIEAVRKSVAQKPVKEKFKLEFAVPLPSVTRATGLKLGDLDGDGDLDAFVCNSDDQEDAIWLNEGRGTFQRSPQSFPPSKSNDVALADVDGDKDLDVVISNWKGTVEIWTNDAAGQFTHRQAISQTANTGIALGDLDGDGDVDLVTTSHTGANHVSLNDGQGHFTDSEQNIEHPESSSVVLGDLDRDGDLDLFITGHQGNRVWFNDAHGRFQASEQLFGGGLCEAVELVDLDADHDLDAVSIGGGFEVAKPRSLWRNDGQGRFQNEAANFKSGRSQSLAVGDLDGDGDADVVFGNLAEPAEVWLNQSNQSTIP